MSDTLTPEEAAKEAVIEYGESAREIFRHWESLRATGWDDDDKLVEALRDLSEAVDALRASRQPKGVKPEECGPCKFRFSEEPEGAALRTLLCGPEGIRMWISVVDEVQAFDPTDRIIPIDPED